MFISGFADEAGADIATQIKAHKELGFNHIDLRTVDKVQFTEVDDATFEKIWGELQAAGIAIAAYGSAIANWSREIRGDFRKDIDDLKRAVPRMKKTNTPYIRVMSWKQGDAPEDEWKTEAIRRMKELAKIAEDGGIILTHENCDGWGGHAIENSLTLIEEVNSPAFKLVFDTGNPWGHGQDAWEFYSAVKDHIAYMHIKDYKEVDGKMVPCFPNEGVGSVEKIVTDLLKNGYDGGFAIEPHIAGAIHKGVIAGEQASAYDIYIEYGRKFADLLERAKKAAGRA